MADGYQGTNALLKRATHVPRAKLNILQYRDFLHRDYAVKYRTNGFKC